MKNNMSKRKEKKPAPKLQINSITNRTFNYSLNECNLSFTLRTDIKEQLITYVELLTVALKEVKEEIEK